MRSLLPPAHPPELVSARPSPKPAPANHPKAYWTSSFSSPLPPLSLNFQHCTMAGRGGPARTNGTAASNKICQFKLVLLGESAVGKSSLVLRFVKGQFHEYQESTIGGKHFLFNTQNCLFTESCSWHQIAYLTHTSTRRHISFYQELYYYITFLAVHNSPVQEK